MNDRTHRIFISYSHRDEAWKDRLVAQLRIVARKGEFDVWHDRRIEAGGAWKTEIEDAIARADTAILLISADFLTSPFIQDEEVGRILTRRSAGNLRVIPLIVKPCPWTAVDWLSDLQARPTDGRALSAAAEHEADADLAALALELFPSNKWIPDGGSRGRWATLGVSLVPAAVAGAFMILAGSMRVTTPLQLDIVAKAVSFDVAGAKAVQLLNNSTAFSRLVIERCDTVSFPPLVGDRDDVEVVTAARAITVRCDPWVPGSRVVVQAGHDRSTGQTAAGEIGTLGRIVADPGDRVTLAITGVEPPEIWLDVSRRATFDFALEKEVPFEIISEFAESDEIPRSGESAVSSFRARLPETSTVRLGTVHARRALSLGIEPAHQSDLEELFRADVDIPLEALSLFERDDVDDRLVSTAISGTLTYPGRPDLDSIPITVGEDVRLGEQTPLRLTQLRVDEEKSGLWFRFQGNATDVSIGSSDRRLTLLNRMFDLKRKLIGVAAVIAIQWAWARRRRSPFRP
jgi:hypothetical protein